MFQSRAVDPALNVYYKSQNHTILTIFTDYVYALNRNKPAEFSILVCFKAEI